MSLFQQRFRIKKHLRGLLEANEFIEVDTPVLVCSPGPEVHMDYFKTEWMDRFGRSYPLWLRSSPELHMKMVMARGQLPKVYQFAPSYRNGGELSRWHNPEFMMLEWYETGVEFDRFVNNTCSMLIDSYNQFHPTDPLHLKDFTWITVFEAFEQYAGITLIDWDVELAQKAKAQSIHSVNLHDDFETAYFKIYIEVIEPELKKLGKVVLTDFPVSQASLAVTRDKRAKRFEILWDGVELCNGFDELLSPSENLQRFNDCNRKRVLENKQPVPHDLDFYQSLKNFPAASCCGVALGFDRFVSMVLEQDSINKTAEIYRSQTFIPSDY